VVQGRLTNPQIPFQQYQEITGQVNAATVINRPLPDSEIIVTMVGGGAGVVSTNENGSFIVPELIFSDSTVFYIQALSKRGNDDIKLSVNHESFPGLVYAPQSPFVRQKKIDTRTVDDLAENNVSFISKAERRTKYEEEMWTIMLKEVEVTAPVIKKREFRDNFWMNSSSNYTMTRETIDDYKLPHIKNYLTMIPGVRTTTKNDEYEWHYDWNTIYYISGIPFVPPAIIFVDGVELIEATSVNALPPDIIESIDIIRTATVLGTRGEGGVISITTRRGGGDSGLEKQNRVVHSPLGYQKPVEFYAPKYETLAARQSPIPDYRTTIFWKPDVVLSYDGEARFEFYSSDYPTTYSVVIEGLTSEGKIVRQVEKITVSGQ
jgi:hypothetical protein